MTIEERVRKKFHVACADYGLLADGDRVLVGLSGGKDSLLLLRLLAERSRLHRPRFEVAAAHVVSSHIPRVVDEACLQRYCDDLGVPLHILHAHHDPSTDHRHTPCFLCSWYRRGTLFRFCEREGYNKLALGHHQDDFITTWLMNATYNGQATTMSPAMMMRHFPFTVIRPLCLVSEAWIRELAPMAEAYFPAGSKTPCPYDGVTKRTEMERVFHQLEALNPEARHSLWRAMTSSNPSEGGESKR